jgi:hypothetical protein
MPDDMHKYSKINSIDDAVMPPLLTQCIARHLPGVKMGLGEAPARFDLEGETDESRVDQGVHSPQRLGIGCSKATALAASKKLSIKEFLLEHPPTTDIQRTLAVGYFLETHGGMTSFTKAELEKGYRDAKEPMPSNIGVNIKHCIRHGHLMEAQEKKNNKAAYIITRSGEQFVAAGYKKPVAGN